MEKKKINLSEKTKVIIAIILLVIFVVLAIFPTSINALRFADLAEKVTVAGKVFITLSALANFFVGSWISVALLNKLLRRKENTDKSERNGKEEN